MERVEKSQTASILTFGCKVNYAESSTIRQQLEQLGFRIVPLGEAPEYVIINTCAVTEQAEKECRKYIRKIHRENPHTKILVTGCYAQLRPAEIQQLNGVAAVFGNTEKHRITEFLSAPPNSCTAQVFVGQSFEFHSAWTGENDERTRAFLKVQDGCDYKCSYCTIPRARGRSRAMPLLQVLQTLQFLEEQGYAEIVLTGINLGEYRTTDGHRFEDLVCAIAELQPKARIRISSIEPNLVTQRIIDTIAHSSVFCHHFHLPLQSGSDTVLRKMRRRYNTKRYQQTVEAILAAIPDCAIGVDVIVGFPGETDALFSETVSFLESLPVAYLHVFSYSDRPGSDAVNYPGKVPQAVKRKRSRILRELSEQKRQAYYQRFVGTVRDWIPEIYDTSAGCWIGWTDNYIRTAVQEKPMMAAGRYSVLIEAISSKKMAQGKLRERKAEQKQHSPFALPIILE